MKSHLPSNSKAAAAQYEEEMFDLFGDADIIEGEIHHAETNNDVMDVATSSDCDAATSMWHDYSAVFPSLQERGRALAQADEWNFGAMDAR